MVRRLSIIVASMIALVLVGGAAALHANTQAKSMDPAIELPDPLLAQNPGNFPRRGGMGWLRDLNLSQQQMQQIQQIRTRYKDQLQSDRDTLRQEQQKLRDLMAGNANDTEIKTQHQKVRDLRIKLADAQFNSMLEMRNVLTVEQRQKFVDRMNQQRGNFRNRMRERMPG
jgi:Spy/CpxP family protein refolding chaperone